MRLKILICLLLGGVTLGIYWPARHFDIIYLNDGNFLTAPEVISGLNWHSLEWVMTGVVVANWHPVTSFSFLLTHQFFGYNPGVEHMVNVFFHTANGVLLFLVLLQLTDAMWRSAIVAAIFGWHPLRVESVAWIAERKDVLFVFFMMLSLLCYANYVQGRMKEGRDADGATRRPYRNIHYILALMFFALSFMGKGTVVTLPFLLLLLDFWPLQRFNGIFGGNRPTLQENPFAKVNQLLVEKIPFFALAFFLSAFTFWIHKTHGDVTSLGEYGIIERFENTVLSYVHYPGKFIWPTRLAMPYPYPKSFNGVQVLLAGLLLLAISAFCVLQIPWRPYLATGWFWYLGTMVPVIGLVQIGSQAMADRHTYVPLIGVTISLAWLVSEWAGTNFFRKWLAGSMTGAILVVCVILTARQLQYWGNDISLFERTIAVTPENSLAQSSLAAGLESKGLLREAAVHYRIAMALSPTDFQMPFQLAECLGKEGYRQAALEEYRTVVADGYDPYDSIANLKFADALAQLGRFREAVSFHEAALRLNPDSAIALNNFAWMLATCPDASVRDGKRAVQLGERGCELTNYRTTLYIGTLAAAYAEAGRFDDAVATAQKAIANAQRQDETGLAKKNEDLLELYRQHRAYHEANDR